VHHAIDPVEAPRGRFVRRKAEEADDAVHVEKEKGLFVVVSRQLFYVVLTGE
jgi:hypothetical protein